MPFRVKICGITNVADALAAADAGADAIGLNFYPQSSRYVTPEDASPIFQAAPPGLLRVAVVVNESAASINWLLANSERPGTTGLQAVQLHGDEPPNLLGDVRCRLIVRARRFTNRGIAAIATDLEACEIGHRVPNAILIDAAAPGQYGGTGTTVSWTGLADHDRWLRKVPLILAGGLTPDNVGEAIRIVRPHAVDVASGVESSPGKKDVAKVRDFVSAALSAFSQLAAQS